MSEIFDTVQSKTEADILRGLKNKQKEIPPKYFYDTRGSLLFDEICKTEEYYVTRTEIEILKENIHEISSVIGKNVLLIEFGSGSSIKTRLLLETADISGYIPIDISYDHLLDSVKTLKESFPHLKICPVHSDYSLETELPLLIFDFSKKVIYFPGSSIGNFKPWEVKEFLKRSASTAGPGGGMLIGFDLVKDKEILERAYNDQQGLTAAFNLNILDNINNLTGSDFHKENFEHLALYDEQMKRIEMHLVSKAEQVVNIKGEEIRIAKDEHIITEFSYKYSLPDIYLLTQEYFDIRKIWKDKNNYFAVCYMQTKAW